MPRSNSRQSKTIPSSTSLSPTQPTSVANTSLRVEQPTLGQSIKQGFGFGAGSAIAHSIIGSLASNTLSPVVPSDKKVIPPCEKELIAFQNCLKSVSSDDFCGQQQMDFTQCLRVSNLH